MWSKVSQVLRTRGSVCLADLYSTEHEYIFLGVNHPLYSVGFCGCMHSWSILNIFKFLYSVYMLMLSEHVQP